MCCTNQPCGLRGSSFASTSSRALLEAFSSFLQGLSSTHLIIVAERQGVEAELWDMHFDLVNLHLSRCASYLEALLSATRSARNELTKDEVVEKQAEFTKIYQSMDFDACDDQQSQIGAQVVGEHQIRTDVREALVSGGDVSAYDKLLEYYEPLPESLAELQRKVGEARSAKSWRQSLVNPETGLNDASAATMGLFMSAKICQSYLTAYYMNNVRVSEGLA